jgi:hypothetical protein
MGPNCEGLHRLLYHLEREVGRYHADTAKSKAPRPTLLRVLTPSSQITESALLWISFLLARFGANTAVLVLAPLGESWMDIIIGEPTESQLYCLRANLTVIPFTTTIPYNMDPEFIERASQLIESSRSDASKQTS